MSLRDVATLCCLLGLLVSLSLETRAESCLAACNDITDHEMTENGCSCNKVEIRERGFEMGCDKDLMTISPRHVDSSESKFKVTNCSRRSTNDDWCTLPDPLLENRSTRSLKARVDSLEFWIVPSSSQCSCNYSNVYFDVNHSKVENSSATTLKCKKVNSTRVCRNGVENSNKFVNTCHSMSETFTVNFSAIRGETGWYKCQSKGNKTLREILLYVKSNCNKWDPGPDSNNPDVLTTSSIPSSSAASTSTSIPSSLVSSTRTSTSSSLVSSTRTSTSSSSEVSISTNIPTSSATLSNESFGMLKMSISICATAIPAGFLILIAVLVVLRRRRKRARYRKQPGVLHNIWKPAPFHKSPPSDSHDTENDRVTEEDASYVYRQVVEKRDILIESEYLEQEDFPSLPDPLSKPIVRYALLDDLPSEKESEDNKTTMLNEDEYYITNENARSMDEQEQSILSLTADAMSDHLSNDTVPTPDIPSPDQRSRSVDDSGYEIPITDVVPNVPTDGSCGALTFPSLDDLGDVPSSEGITPNDREHGLDFPPPLTTENDEVDLPYCSKTTEQSQEETVMVTSMEGSVTMNDPLISAASSSDDSTSTDSISMHEMNELQHLILAKTDSVKYAKINEQQTLPLPPPPILTELTHNIESVNNTDEQHNAITAYAAISNTNGEATTSLPPSVLSPSGVTYARIRDPEYADLFLPPLSNLEIIPGELDTPGYEKIIEFLPGGTPSELDINLSSDRLGYEQIRETTTSDDEDYSYVDAKLLAIRIRGHNTDDKHQHYDNIRPRRQDLDNKQNDDDDDDDKTEETSASRMTEKPADKPFPQSDDAELLQQTPITHNYSTDSEGESEEEPEKESDEEPVYLDLIGNQPTESQFL